VASSAQRLQLCSTMYVSTTVPHWYTQSMMAAPIAWGSGHTQCREPKRQQVHTQQSRQCADR